MRTPASYDDIRLCPALRCASRAATRPYNDSGLIFECPEEKGCIILMESVHTLFSFSGEKFRGTYFRQPCPPSLPNSHSHATWFASLSSPAKAPNTNRNSVTVFIEP
jgi:hypothetical protein